MILIDYSAVAISNIMKELYTNGNPEGGTPSLDLVRHMIYNAIRSFKVKFGEEYRQMVICCDDKDYWRKNVFPHYKYRRKEEHKESAFDWQAIYQCVDAVKENIKENFPYKFVQVPHAEADDVIAVLTRAFSDKEKILIISGDEDFLQLHENINVSQYSPVKKQFLTTPDAATSLKELIIRGDKGDGVPNFLSEDNCFVDRIRQKSIMEKKLAVWLQQDPSEFVTPDLQMNWNRNRSLVDFTLIPVDIIEAILEAYQQPPSGNKQTLFNHFIACNMRIMMESIGDF